MKRGKVTYPNVKIVKPFFWKECRFCGKEFKREQGYEIEDYTMINAHLYWSYCCNNCCKSIDEVLEKLKQEEIDFDELGKNWRPPTSKIIKNQ